MTIVDEFRANHERVLDRLVDGELGQAERRDLLAALDDEPGGWRSCALAFLEAQSFRWQLSRLAAEQSLRQVEVVPVAAEIGRGAPASRPGGWWAVCLAVAASLLLAFGLGTRFPTSWPSVTSPDPSAAPETQIAATPASEGRGSAVDDSDSSDLGSITLALSEGDETDEIELPVAVADEDADEWLDGLETSVPVELIERLRAAGYDVVRRQRLYPVELSDGRRLVVPVEHVEIRDPNSVESL